MAAISGIGAAEAHLLGAVPHPNILDAHPQHACQRHPRIGPVPYRRFGPARLAGWAISVKNPPNPNYISISLWGFFTIQRSAAFFVAQRVGNSRLISLAANGSASHPRSSHSASAPQSLRYRIAQPPRLRLSGDRIRPQWLNR
jgi:hypothetical protein